MNKYKHLKGPVYSRRLGKSLGIDLLPDNICSEDCIYCECGSTKNLTVERREYVPVQKVLRELDERLQENPQCDYITFSGRGEPTLHSGIGKIINFLAKHYSQYNIAVLTNSTLLDRNSVQQELMNVDLVVPSLDASSNKTFQQICRPADKVSFERLLRGIIEFSSKFTGKIFLEILLIKNLNDTQEEINGFKKLITKIEPDRIDLNTVDRKPADKRAKSLSKEKLEKIAQELPDNTQIWR